MPFVIITITNNTAGGQPVDLDNIKEVYSLCQTYGKMLIFDSARFAENAYFIKQRNPKYANSSIKEIVKEIYSYADATTMSAKKDAIVNMGGFIGMKSKSLFDKASVYNIMFEGFITYGGMSGRDMNALAQGLDENTEFSTLENRIEQVAYLGRKLVEYGVPVQEPFGGHAIFVDAKRFFPHIPKEHYLAQTLAVETYIEGGVRGVEIGSILADRDPITKLDRFPKLELMRLAIPRRTYTNNHMDYVAATLGNVFERRNSIKSGFRITHEAPILRHFTVELERI